MRFTAVIKWSRERFMIEDDAGKPQFGVQKIYGLDGNSLSLRNLDDIELAAIKECSGPTRCEITIGDDQPITVRHQGWFGRKYSISTPAGEMSATVGDFSLQSYELISFGTAKATVSRQLIRQGHITIDMADGENEVPLLATVLAIETLRDNRRQTQDSIPYVRLVLRLVN
jgi:uncharacterized protein YxjI